MNKRNTETLKHIIRDVIEEEYYSEEVEKKFLSEITDAVNALGGVDNENDPAAVKQALSKYPDNGILQKINDIAEGNTEDAFKEHEVEYSIFTIDVDGDKMDLDHVTITDFDADEEHDGFSAYLSFQFVFDDEINSMGVYDSYRGTDPYYSDPVEIFQDINVIATYDVSMMPDYTFDEEDFWTDDIED